MIKALIEYQNQEFIIPMEKIHSTKAKISNLLINSFALSTAFEKLSTAKGYP